MISKYWNQFPLVVPIDGQLIWCRVDRWSGAPFAGRYSSADGTITSLINGITYPQWAISAWREADPPINIPPNPITGIFNANSDSAITLANTTAPRWLPQFTSIIGTTNWNDFAILISLSYADPALGNPSMSTFQGFQKWTLARFQTTQRFWIFGDPTSRNSGSLLYNIYSPGPFPFVSGYRMFVSIQVIHKATGYFYPNQIFSVQVTA